MSKKIMLVFFSIMLTSNIYGGMFELGKPHKTPYQVGVYFYYENDDEYYDYDLKKMQKMPDDWYYIYYSISFYYKVNLTKNIGVKFSFPYYIKRTLKFYSNGSEYYKEGTDWGDITVSLEYRYFTFKKIFIKSGKISASYIFNRGSDELLIDAVSYGRNDISLKHSIIFVFPKKWSKKLNKKLSLQNDFGYTISGITRSSVMDYSKTGFKNGDAISVKTKINYILNSYVKISLYSYYSYNYDDKDANDNIVEDSYKSVHSIGISVGWRPFGDSSVNLQFGNEYPVKYKDSYVAYFNPSVKISYSF